MTEPLAKITATTHGPGPLIRLSGEIDMSNADTVADTIRSTTGTVVPVTLDLGPVDFIDSSALNMLIQLSAEFDRTGGKLTIIAAPGSIAERLFTITHMDAHLDIRAALDD